MPYLPLQQSDIPSSTSTLISNFLSTSTWIWSSEDSSLYTLPDVPAAAESAFRLIWTNPSPSSQTPSSTTIVITADNYFELFVNGYLLHAADPNHAWEHPFMFRVPLPDSERVTYAVRVVNGFNDNGTPDSVPNPAGLRAAIQIDFTASTTPITLDTVEGAGWRTSHTFDNGWEQPGFNDRNWEAAKEMPTTRKDSPFPVWYTMNAPTQLYLATPLPTSTTPTSTPTQPPAPGITTFVSIQTIGTSIITATQTSRAIGTTTTTGVPVPTDSTTFGAPGPAPTPTDQQLSSSGLPSSSQLNVAYPQGEPSGVLIGIALCAVLFRMFTSLLSL